MKITNLKVPRKQKTDNILALDYLVFSLNDKYLYIKSLQYNTKYRTIVIIFRFKSNNGASVSIFESTLRFLLYFLEYTFLIRNRFIRNQTLRKIKKLSGISSKIIKIDKFSLNRTRKQPNMTTIMKFLRNFQPSRRGQF